MSTDKELYKLELLSLVAQVSQELFNHTKLQDKNLAEFVIAVSRTTSRRLALMMQLHEQSKSFDVFQAKLGQVGSDFPEWFVKNLDRLIVTMHPKYKRKAAKAKAKAAKSNPSQALADDVKQLQSRKFPGLSVPDQDWSPAEKYVEERTRREPEEKLPASISMDDTMAQLAAVAARRNDRPAAEDYLDGEPSAKRQRQSDSRDGYRDVRYERGRDERPRDNGYADRGRPRPMLDDRPVLYKIYNGVVQNIRDFGAFVSLEGLQGRVEGTFIPPFLADPLGMVHVSNITGARLENPAEVLKRNDRVKVKVMSVAGTKYGLSMKDVDQKTGADLS